MKNRSIIAQLSITLFIVMFLVGAPQAVLSQTELLTEVFIDPASVTATTCSTETVAVAVSDVENLTGYHLELSFDPSIVEVTDVVNGGFLDGADDAAFYEPSNEIDRKSVV